MYSMYAEAHRYKLEILNANPTELGGYKEISFSIEGTGAYSRLKFESGVHRVQRVPETESGGRVHTSTATVAVLPQVDWPTGVVEVSLDERGVPAYTIIEDVAWDNVPYTDEMKVLAAQAAAVCFGTLAQRSPVSRAAIRQFIADMPADSLKVYDINLRQNFYSREIIDDSLKVSDILKINDEEIEIVSSLFGLEGTPEAACRELIGRYGLQLVILTKGSEGSEVVTAGKVYSLACPEVEIADTVGAGDSFTAAFVNAYLRGDSIEECHKIANDISAFVCSRHGAMPDY